MAMASFNVNVINRGRLFFFINGLVFILVIAFSVRDLVLFYIFFEASLIPITAMVLGWGYQPERVQARNYLVLYTVMASLPLLSRILYMGHINRHISFFLVQ
jgi:NADH-ubiquinone oxidoreductase chain 4